MAVGKIAGKHYIVHLQIATCYCICFAAATVLPAEHMSRRGKEEWNREKDNAS